MKQGLGVSGEMGPRRIQLSRRKGWRIPPNTVKVDRTTRFGNQFAILALDCGRFAITRNPDSFRFGIPDSDATYADTLTDARAEAVRRYSDWARSDHGKLHRGRIEAELRGQDIACWCPLDQPCHADVLLELANAQGIEAAIAGETRSGSTEGESPVPTQSGCAQTPAVRKYLLSIINEGSD